MSLAAAAVLIAWSGAAARAQPAAASPASGEIDPRDVYAFVLKRGRAIPATTFSAPDKKAVRLEDRACYIGVFDPEQRFATDGRGRLLGGKVICQLLTRTRGGQVSFTDFGCSGRDEDALIEGPGAPVGKPKQGQLHGEMSRCLEGQLKGALSSLWTRHVTEDAAGKRGARMGDPAKTLQGIDDLGRAYYRFYGAAALKKLSKDTLWSYGAKGRATAQPLFERASWWGAEQDALTF